jgi:hypothetical protein
LVEWLTPLKTKLLRNSPKWKPSCFIVNNVAQELWALRWIWFSFYFFLSFYVHITISKLHSAFSIVDHVISWNKNKLVFYAWLGWCGARIKCPFTFAHGTSQRLGVYVQWKKNQGQWCVTCNILWLSHHHVYAHWTRWKHWNFHDLWEK